MYPYYILVFAPILFSTLRFKGQSVKARKQQSIKLFFILLFILLALRGINVGKDLQNYLYIFNSYSQQSWSAIVTVSTEPAFAVLNKLVSVFSNNFQWLLVVTAAIIIIPICYQYAKNAEDPVLTIALFITMSTFVMFFSGIRQGIAIALGMVAFEFTKRKKLFGFILIVTLAMLFHTSAFMLAFMYPLYHVRITKKWLPVVIPVMIVAFIFNRSVFGFLGEILNDFTKYNATISSTGAYTMLILFVLFSTYCFVIPNEATLDADTIGMRNFLLFSTVLQMFAPLHTLAMRMNYYYIIFIPLLIPKIISRSSNRLKQVTVVSRYCMIIFFIIYFFINAPKSNVLNTFPYHFFWENVQ